MTVVGVDCGKNKVDAVALGEHDCILSYWYTDLTKERRGLERDLALKRMRFDMTAFLREMPDPVVVYVEEAIMMRSVRTAIWMAHTVGMILTLPYPVYTVAIDSWKQELCKAGADKARVKEVVSGRYPNTVQMFGDRQDLFDATGVAVFGQADQQFRAGLGATPTSNPS